MNRLQNVLLLFREDVRAPPFARRLLLAAGHAVFLLALTIALQYTSFIRVDEMKFLKWAAIWKHNVLHNDPKPELDSVVFIDVSRDLELADDPLHPQLVTWLPGGKKVITDRDLLARLFAVLAQHAGEYRFVVCDVLFQDTSHSDSALRPRIERTGNLLASAVWENGTLVPPVFRVPYALANYQAVNGTVFIKMPVYYQGQLKSLPATLYEKTTGHRFRQVHGLVMLDGRPTFNTVIPEFYYRAADLADAAGPHQRVNLYYLNTLLIDPGFFAKLRGKIIIIGDFKKNDMHPTYLGNMPGPLLIWDTYLTLKNKPVSVSASWLLAVWLVYFAISYWMIFHPDRKIKSVHEQVKAKIKVGFVNKFIIKYLSFIGILVLLNIFSYFYFGTFIGLFYIATYLTFIQLVIDKWPEWKSKVLNFYHRFNKKAT